VYHAQNVSKAVLLWLCKEDVSRGTERVPPEILSTSFAFHVGIRGILEEDVLVSENLQSDMGSGVSP
jgi:hypothetical protein